MNRTTDQFGWREVIHEPLPYDTPPIHRTDVIDLTRTNTTDDQTWQPDGGPLGPVYGQSVNSPWFGNASPSGIQQVSQQRESVGPAVGASNGVTTWRQWLTATEVPASTIASETFASVYEFPYAFRG